MVRLLEVACAVVRLLSGVCSGETALKGMQEFRHDMWFQPTPSVMISNCKDGMRRGIGLGETEYLWWRNEGAESCGLPWNFSGCKSCDTITFFDSLFSIFTMRKYGDF